jgi:hypothetical protein
METKHLTKEFLNQHFVQLDKTSRQISREFNVSRKIVNLYLLSFGLIKRSELEENDLP